MLWPSLHMQGRAQANACTNNAIVRFENHATDLSRRCNQVGSHLRLQILVQAAACQPICCVAVEEAASRHYPPPHSPPLPLAAGSTVCPQSSSAHLRLHLPSPAFTLAVAQVCCAAAATYSTASLSAERRAASFSHQQTR